METVAQSESDTTWDAALPDVIEDAPQSAQPNRLDDHSDTHDRLSHQGYYVDGPHVTRSEPQPTAALSTPTAETASSVAAFGEQSFDEPLDWSEDDEEDSQNFASRIYRLHAAVAPFAGVIVAVALVLSAGLLYWLALSPPRHTVDHDDLTVPPLEVWNHQTAASEQESVGDAPLATFAQSPPREIGRTAAPAWATGSATPVYGDATGTAATDPPATTPSAELPSVGQTPLASIADSPRHVARPSDEAPSAEAQTGAVIARHDEFFESTGSATLDVDKMFPPASIAVSPVDGNAPVAAAPEAQVAERPFATSPIATSNR